MGATVTSESAVAASPARKPTRPSAPKVRGYWGGMWSRLRYDYVTLFCLALLVAIILSAVFAPELAPMDPYKSSMAHRLKPIGYHNYLLGTDEQGRDMLSRMLYGGRVSLAVGIVPVGVGPS